MSKSLSETARSILMKEGAVPSVSSSDNNPDRDADKKTSNANTLKPKSQHADADPKSNEAEDLGGATPTSTAKENLGAKAAGGTSKDSSKASMSKVPSEKAKKLSDLAEDIEMTEELESFIAEKQAEGLSEEEILEAISENFEVIEEELSEEEEVDEEADEIDEEELDEISKKTLGSYIKKASADREYNAMDAATKFIGKAPKSNQIGSHKNYKKMVNRSTGISRAVDRLTKEEIDMSEHVDALLAGETLSEEFRTKATTIFESAVSAKVKEEVELLEQAYEQSLEEQLQVIHTELSEKIDDYLNYTVEQWILENEVAIEAGLRTELTEDFISGLRNLFSEHYIDIPDEKAPIVEELGSKVEELEAKLNEEIERNVQLSKQINEAVRFEVIVSECEGLTNTQAEKLKTLAEGVEFTTEDEFAGKIKTLKESYFTSAVGNNQKTLDSEPDANSGVITEELSPRMGSYVRTLGKLK